VLQVLHSERIADAAPATVYATLLEEGTYRCSSLRCTGRASAARPGDWRRHATHPAKVKPELVADALNRVRSWEITKLRGPAKWTFAAGRCDPGVGPAPPSRPLRSSWPPRSCRVVYSWCDLRHSGDWGGRDGAGQNWARGESTCVLRLTMLCN
jgi:hypothetical protein